MRSLTQTGYMTSPERRCAAADRLARAESELAQARAARDRHDTEANRERVGRAFDEREATTAAEWGGK